MSGEDPYLRRVEWESYAEPFKMAIPEPIEGLPPGIESITLRRDEQYRLVADLAGKADAEAYGRYYQTLREQAPGTMLTDRLYVVIKHKIGVDHLRLGTGVKHGWTAERGQFSWTDERPAYRFRQAYANRPEDSRPGWHTDWFLNGPHRFILDQPTNHSATAIYVRDRGGGRKVVLRRPRTGGGRLDHILVNAGDFEFVLHQVPEPFGPRWSKNLGIEYAWATGAVPDEGVREAIGELVGFVIGRRLIPVGSTTFDRDGYPIETDACTPWGDESQAVCTRPDDSPLDVEGKLDGSRRLDEILPELVPRYLKARDELALKDALWSYWLAKEAPLGLDLPIYSAAVESLQAAWFRSTRTKVKGTYVSKEKFNDLLQDAFALAEQALQDEPYRDRIMNRMRGSFQMGASERLDAFLSEIGLPIGAQERAAIKGRHRPAHGGTAVDDEKLSKLQLHSATYKVLFERVFLRLLEYEGPYVDRATLRFPLRNLNESVGHSDAAEPTT
jgi:hypothetical protein